MKALVWLMLVMLCVGCGARAESVTVTPNTLPNILIAAPTLLPPVMIPTAVPTRISSVRCPSAPPMRLIVQERGRVTRNNERLNLREGPGISYEAVGLLAEGAIFLVLDGPACSGDFTWFRVQARGVEGWLAEGDSEQYYVEPYLVG